MSLRTNGLLDQLCQSAPKVLTSLRDVINQKIDLAQQTADELVTLFKNYLLVHSNNVNIAFKCIMEEHLMKVGTLTQCLSVFQSGSKSRMR